VLWTVPVRQQLPAPPVFQGGVDLIAIEVQITPAQKATGLLRVLTPADFEITISGKKRAAATVAFLHNDTGPVHRFPFPADAYSSACSFGFLRTTDRPTAHYLVAVPATAADQADQKEVKDLRPKVVDKAFAVQQWEWRVRPVPAVLDHRRAPVDVVSARDERLSRSRN
jgi:hypothetical protein